MEKELQIQKTRMNLTWCWTGIGGTGVNCLQFVDSSLINI